MALPRNPRLGKLRDRHGVGWHRRRAEKQDRRRASQPDRERYRSSVMLRARGWCKEMGDDVGAAIRWARALKQTAPVRP